MSGMDGRQLGPWLRARLRKLQRRIEASPRTTTAMLAVLQRLSALPALGPWLHHPSGLLASAAGRRELAITEHQTALTLDRVRTNRLHRQLGWAQMGLGQLQAAEQSFRRAVAREPGAIQARLHLAEVLLLDRASEAEPILARSRRWA